MAETFISSSSYDPNKFINREDEIQQILSLLKQSQPRVRAVVIDGDRGVGKTWLSLHLQRTVFKQEVRGVTSWLFSLWSPGENYHPEGEKEQANECFVREGRQLTLEEFLKIITQGLSIEWPPQPSLAEMVDSIRRYVQSHADNRFVLILDSAYESDWSLLEQLETYFLGNLLTLSNFFVIVTGRGRPYPWKIPYLIEAIRFGLGPFSVEQIKQQIDRFKLTPLLQVNEIYNIGSGWPLFTEHLARSQNVNHALVVAVNILFAVVPIQEREQLRRYFEALSPLDGFGETEAELLVGTYEKNTAQDGRTICKRMNETRLISWKNGRYEINEPVRKILRQHLLLNSPLSWVRLNCAAFRHFEMLSGEPTMQRFRSFFEAQMRNHAMMLSDAGVGDPHECSSD